jgi:hypothetical protein
VPDTVTLAGRWSLYVDDRAPSEPVLASLRITVKGLKVVGFRQVVVMGQLPTWHEPVPRTLRRARGRDGVIRGRMLEGLDSHGLQLGDEVRAAMAGGAASFVSPLAHLCNALGRLDTRTENGIEQPMAHDASHLTPAGSVALVQLSQPLLAHWWRHATVMWNR